MASKHMSRSRKSSRAVEAQVKAAKAAIAADLKKRSDPIEIDIPEEILAMGDAQLGKELHAARRNGWTKWDRLKQLEAAWKIRLASLDDG